MSNPPAWWPYRRLWLADLAALLAVTAGMVVLFHGPAPDLWAQRLFVTGGTPEHAWNLRHFWLWRCLYEFGPWLSVALAAVAFGLLAWGCFRPRLAVWRIYCTFFILSLSLGPGLLVNLVLKEHWGRPRPREVTVFGGEAAYRAPLDKGTAGAGKSFPCGHSSMGYFLALFYFIFRRRHRKWGWLGLALALAWGTLIGLARMAAGAHFLSDVAWSALLPFMVSWWLYYFMLNVPAHEDACAAGAPARTGWGTLALAGALLLALVAGALLATPLYEPIHHRLPLPAGAPAGVRLEADRADFILDFDDTAELLIDGTAEGFGWTADEVRHALTVRSHTAVFQVSAHGPFMEYAARIAVRLPARGAAPVEVRTARGGVRVRAAAAPAGPVRIAAPRGAVRLPPAWRGQTNVTVEAAQVSYE